MKPGSGWPKMQRDLRLLLSYYENLDETPSVDDFFVGLVRDNMVALTRATQCGGRLSAQDCEHLSVAMANIGHAAEAMGYPVVKATLNKIGPDLPEAGESASPQRRAKIAAELAPAQALIRDMVCLAETGAI